MYPYVYSMVQKQLAKDFLEGIVRLYAEFTHCLIRDDTDGS